MSRNTKEEHENVGILFSIQSKEPTDERGVASNLMLAKNNEQELQPQQKFDPSSVIDSVGLIYWD